MQMQSLYDFRGQVPAGESLGLRVFEIAKERGVPYTKRELDPKTGYKTATKYPIRFLESIKLIVCQKH